MLASSFLFDSSSKLLVTRAGIKAWLSLILGRTRPLILELLALEWRKFHTFELEYLWSQLANLDQILCVASLGWGKGCIRFWGKLTLAQVSDRCPLGYLFLLIRSKVKIHHISEAGVSFKIQFGLWIKIWAGGHIFYIWQQTIALINMCVSSLGLQRSNIRLHPRRMPN